MSFENSSVPLSFFNNESMVCTTNKSDFMAKLKELVPRQSNMESLPNGIDCIPFDGMYVVHVLLPPQSFIKPTYHNMASLFWQYVLKRSSNIPSVHVVFDSYTSECSINVRTRERRGKYHTSNTAPTYLQPNMPYLIGRMSFLAQAAKGR